MNIVSEVFRDIKLIYPDNRSKCMQFAIDELKAYLNKIFLDDIRSPDTVSEIIIGGPCINEATAEFISADEFDIRCPGPEGIMLKHMSGSLLVAGSSKNDDGYDRAVLYAVYEFLERYLGCSLAAYSSDKTACGEYVPKLDAFILPEFEYIKPKADLSYRTAVVQYDAWAGNPNHELNYKFISWLAKNRYNRILTWASIYEGFKSNGMLNEAEKRGMRFSVGHHEATRLFLPADGNSYFAEKYYETHPEYYRLQKDGSRYYMEPDSFLGQLTLCMRNVDCIRAYAANIIKWIELNPMVDIITLWPNDFIDEQCVCDKCGRYSKNANYTYFVNEVSKIVNRVYPDVKFDRIVYVDMLHPDEDTVVMPSVLVDQAVWQGELRCGGKPDGSCIIGKSYDDILKAWMAKGSGAVLYDYYMGNYGSKQRLLPLADEMQAVCGYFSQVGVYGIGTQIECYNIWNNIINFYTYGRTAYDSGRSLEDNLDLFCRIFGEGGCYIKAVVLMCEAIYDGQVSLDKGGIYLINNIDKDKVYSLYDTALGMAQTAKARNAIRLMRMAFRYSDLEVSFKSDIEAEGFISDAADDKGELKFMRSRFNSYRNPSGGEGISIAVEDGESSFIADRWYNFE